jgi:LPS-assembly lipoprotein
MSWYKSRRIFLGTTAGAACLLVSGCGFQPLYGAKSLGSVDAELARIKIGVISERTGQQLHNYLLDRINREGRPENPLYLLSVEVKVETERQALESDKTATRAKLVFTAGLRLQDITTEEILLTSWARSVTSYDIVSSAIATRSAELDAIDRAARDASNEIRSLLVLYFQNRGAEAEG